MANNRMWFKNTRTLAKILLAKYYPSTGWVSYKQEDLGQRIDEVLEKEELEEADGSDTGRTDWTIEYEQGLPAWHPASQLPEPGKKVLAHYKNDLGKNRIVVGFWIPEKFHEADPEFDEIAIYDQESDKCFWPGGWYEAIDNWDDYSAVVINHEVLAWMPLPALPTGDCDEA